MADGSITFQVNLDETKAKRELSRLQASIKKVTDELNSKKEKQSAIEAEIKSASAEAKKTETVIASLKKEILEYQRLQNEFGIKNPLGLSDAQAALKEQEAILKKQDAEVQKLYSSYEKITDSISKSEDSLKGMEDKVSQIADEMKRPTPFLDKMDEQFESAQKSAKRFGRRLAEIAKSALFFNLVSSGLRRISEFIGKTLQTNAEYTAQLAKLRGAFLTAFEPIYSYILPGLISILKVITSIVNVVANVISGLFGKTASQSAKNAKALNEQAAAIGGVGAAAEKAKKQLLEFDTLNILHNEESGSGGGGAGGSKVNVDFSEFDTDVPKSKVDELTAYLSGALLGLGAILAFSGVNIPLGLGLMSLGAAGLVSVTKENWGAMSDELKTALVRVSLILGVSMLALGAVLAFSGVRPGLGLALMAIGAAGLVAATVINWHDVSDKTKDTIRDIALAISAFSLVIGAVLVFSGANIKLGLGILALSAISFATAASLDWGYVSANIRSELTKILLILGVSTLVLGAILAFSGVSPALGIKLMAIGASGLATAAVLNWNTISEEISNLFTQYSGWIAITSAALLVIGLVLAFTGVALPLGIALIALGAAGLVTVTALNWDTIKAKLTETWDKIKDWFATTIAPVFTIEYWQSKFQAIGDGIVAAIKEGLENAKKQIEAFFTGESIEEEAAAAIEDHYKYSTYTPNGHTGRSGKWATDIASEKEDVEAAVEDLVEDGIIATAEDSIEANNPEQIGEAVTDGVAAGLKGLDGKLGPWQETYSSFIQAAVDDAQRGAREIEAAFNGITINSPTIGIGGSVKPGFASIPRMRNMPTPRIPHLAKGTVIPPRAPFLAVLGDQSRGTNVEAPLSTIQEAVARALPIRELIAAIQEGNSLSRDLIYAVDNIDDSRIGKMANRYNRGLDRAYGR